MSNLIVSLVYLFVLIPIAVIWSGFVLSILWDWFLVPTLGAPHLSIPTAIGLALVVSYMTHQKEPERDKPSHEQEAISTLVYSLMKPAVALLIGYIVSRWI